MPGRVRQLRLLLLAALFAFAASACATSKPYVSVVGTTQGRTTGRVARSLVVVVEIHNPTNTPLRLSQLEYTLFKHGDESRTRGTVQLHDTIGPGHTSTVDIAVPVSAGAHPAAYDIKGRLRGFAGEIELNWKIAALGQSADLG
jgi:LEA14-like dessication related protein